MQPKTLNVLLAWLKNYNYLGSKSNLVASHLYHSFIGRLIPIYTLKFQKHCSAGFFTIQKKFGRGVYWYNPPGL